MVPENLVSFLESNVSMHFATRDAALLGESVRAWGALVSDDRRTLTVYLAQPHAAHVLENLKDNGRAAVVFSRIHDFVTCQIKGRFVSVREADARDRRIVENYREGLIGEICKEGYEREVFTRWRFWPCLAVDIEVEELYSQTPGPGAGDPLQ